MQREAPLEPGLAPLPAEVVPFPVEPGYVIRPDLVRMEPDETHFLLDTAWPRYLERKLELLETEPERCRVPAGDGAELRRGLWRVAQLLATEQPERFGWQAGRVSIAPFDLVLGEEGELNWAEEMRAPRLLSRELLERIRHHLESLEPEHRLADALALAVQEDLVLMAGPAGSDSARLLHVCLPSHWNPGERQGASFAQLHAPVPHNERLLAGSRNMLAAMLNKGPFKRYVWSITRNGSLDQNPARVGGSAPREPERAPVAASGSKLLERLYFRSERQTTRALRSEGSSARRGMAGEEPESSEFALFTIRVYVTPLSSVLTRERAGVMARAVRSMDEKLLRYKSLEDIRGSLLAALDEMAQ